MRIAIYGDPHWCQYSSIVRRQGNKYSVRLENLIDSLNWVEETASEKGCRFIVCLGDFFDRPDLNATEISALKEVRWNNNIGHYFIVGNHEMGKFDLSENSADLFSFLPSATVVDKPFVDTFTGVKKNVELAFLPYVLEDNRKEISFNSPTWSTPRVLFMHNDIKGVQMGQFISQSGYEIEEIEQNCDLCFNGHLHSGKQISDKIINVGNLTGQNFSEDAHLYSHGMYILETDDFSYEFVENPFAFNFYKIDLTDKDFSNYDKFHFNVKNNAVCTIKCNSSQSDFVKQSLEYNTNIVESRIIIVSNPQSNGTAIDTESFSIDHIKYFNEYMIENFGNIFNEEILLQELAEVSK